MFYWQYVSLFLWFCQTFFKSSKILSISILISISDRIYRYSLLIWSAGLQYSVTRCGGVLCCFIMTPFSVSRWISPMSQSSPLPGRSQGIYVGERLSCSIISTSLLWRPHLSVCVPQSFVWAGQPTVTLVFEFFPQASDCYSLPVCVLGAGLHLRIGQLTLTLVCTFFLRI